MAELNANEEKVVAMLPAGLAALTTALAAVGGLTGGIARMFRNNPDLAIGVLLLMVGAVLVALVAQFIVGWHASGARALVALGILCFVTSLAGGMWMAVDTAKETDRPNLSAELTKTSDGRWTIKGTASASGLRASGSLQVYLYGYPASDSGARTKLASASAGPNAEGIATQAFNVPLPVDQEYVSFVVTAAVGEEARFCDGAPIQISARLNEVGVPVAEQDAGNSACVVLRPPPTDATDSATDSATEAP